MSRLRLGTPSLNTFSFQLLMSNVSDGVDSIDTGMNRQRPMSTPTRVASIDVYRGLVMFLMLAEILHLDKLRSVFESDTWIGTIAGWIQFNTTHVAWTGCSLHDMIQPSFTFLVGAAMAFSIVSRQSKGQSWFLLLRHAMGRSLILIVLGIFLRSLGKPSTNFTFDDTLTQIGLGYWILFLLSSLTVRGLSVSLAIVLVGYWVCFILYPAPGADFPYAQNGVPVDWPEHWKEGMATHFNKNSNLAWAFDRVFGRWIRNLELYTDAGNHDSRADRRTVDVVFLGLGTQVRNTSHSGERVFDSVLRCRHVGNLPNRQANLDTIVDPLEWRDLLSLFGRS